MTSALPLAGKTALITGGGRGIGAGIARSLAEAGAEVFLADIDLDIATSAAKDLQQDGLSASQIRVDVTSEESVTSMVETVVERAGRLDIAVNSAGVLGVSPIESISSADWDRVLDVNAKGVFLSCKHELAAMRKLEGSAGCSIVNIASLAGKVGLALQTHYTASKFAVVGFTNALAKELAHEGITVNSICPGIVGTRMWLGQDGTAHAKRQPGESDEDSWLRHQKEMLPQGVAQSPEDIGRTVVFLALSPHITGQAISVDGGAGA